MADRTRIILFGAGLFGREFYPKIGGHVDVVAFSDNDTNKHGVEMYGVQIIPPAQINSVNYDYVVITATAIAEIYEQLKMIGVPEEKIILVNDAKEGRPIFPWDAVLFLSFLVIAGVFLFAYMFV